jgi:hypothetical protein
VLDWLETGSIVLWHRTGRSRWREGWKFVVRFEADGKKRSKVDPRKIVKEGPNAVPV